MSVEEAKRTALERAKIQAIADEFGTLVSQSTSTIITNNNGESDTQFFSLGGSDVKGEWIETIGEPSFDITFEKHFLVVKCHVRGEAKEIVSSKVEFIAKTLRNGTSLKFESTEFKDGDDMYLYFKSPESGYLSVFLMDDTNKLVYSILPYKRSDGAPYAIAPNQEYIFFSVPMAKPNERSITDEYCMNCSDQVELNTLYVLFSKCQYSKLSMRSDINGLPAYTANKDFLSWLTSFRKSIDNSVQIIDIKIQK
jgi:hypothetical protein